MALRSAGVVRRGGVPQMWSGVTDDVLVPEAALPTQFAEIWHKTRAIAPERALALAVLSEAVSDLRKHRFAGRRRQQRLYWEAYEWVAAEDRSWPYSFFNLCETLNLTAELVRRELLGEMMPVPLPRAEGAEAGPEPDLERAA